MTTTKSETDGVHAPGSTCDCQTPKVVWRTAWGWRARRIPGVFFANQSEAMDAYIASSAQEIVVDQAALDELEDIVRELLDLDRDLDSDL